MTNFEDLRKEYDEETFGTLMLGRVTSIVKALLARRDPLIYAQGAHSARDGLDDVVNSFVLDELLHQEHPQIRYIMDVATDVEDFDRLVRWQARRYLARERARSLASNLVARAKRRLERPPFTCVDGHGAKAWGLAGRAYSPGTTNSFTEIRMAAVLAAAVPTLKVTATERLPKMYDAMGLEAMLRLLVDSVAGVVFTRDLQTFFDLVFTAWSTSHLDQHDDQTVPTQPVSTEDQAVAGIVAREIESMLTVEQATIFLHLRAGLPDQKLATALELSRPTAIKRRRELTTQLQERLADLNEPAQRLALANLYVLLATRGGDP